MAVGPSRSSSVMVTVAIYGSITRTADELMSLMVPMVSLSHTWLSRLPEGRQIRVEVEPL